MAAVEALPNKDLQLMYSLLRASYGPAVVPKHVADVLKVQKVSLVRNAFSDFVDGDRLSTALAFALADIIGPGSRELARTLNKDEAEGEKLSLIGREAVCYFLLALMRGGRSSGRSSGKRSTGSSSTASTPFSIFIAGLGNL